MAPPMAQIKRVSTGSPMSQIQSVGPPPIAQNEKRFCLSNGGCIFLVISVSVKTTSEEFQNLSLPEDYVPNIKINPITLNVNARSSIVSVGSMVYSIGGGKLDERKTYIPTTEVTKFDTDQPNLKLESCCNMIVPRVSPAVVAIDGKIYVFGGFSPIKQTTFKESPWAECLDTNKPIYKQKWKALKEPVSRLSWPVAVHYEAETILISTSSFKEDDIIYNVANESSIVYDSKLAWEMINPVTLFDDKTVYWIDEGFFRAYELDKGICYLAYTREVIPDFEKRFWSTTQGPILVHLKDNLFNIFTLFAIGSHPNMVGILECTKIRVTKCINKYGQGVLQLERLGYQSYRCDPLWSLSSVVPIEARRD